MEDLTSPRVLRETLARYGLSPRKSLGQNFLIDANLRDKIITAADPRPEELVIEIGPGPGALTNRLLASGAALLAVEADPGLARVLIDRMPPEPDRSAVVVGDVLRLDLAALVAAHGWTGRPSVAVGNLPYYITTPAIFHLLAAGLDWRRMVFLVQLEVAERMVAAPGGKDYGLLSIMVQCRSAPEIITTMPPSVFWPPPGVRSALIRLNMPGRQVVPEGLRPILEGLTRAAFGQRRKTLANACRVWADSLGLAEGFIQACGGAEIDPGRRGEELSVGDFIRLAGAIAGELSTRGLCDQPSRPRSAPKMR